MAASRDQEGVAALTEIVLSRRSVRSFSAEPPSREDVEAVLTAGLAAPFAAAMAPGGRLDRRFFVLPRTGAAFEQAMAAIRAHAVRALQNDALPAPVRARMEPIADGRATVVGTAPCCLIVAEAGSVRDVVQQTLAHVLENMWLMATALGLGMQLLSVTSTMSDDPAFCRILGLSPGEYHLNGCALGIPRQPPEPRAIPDLGSVTNWLD